MRSAYLAAEGFEPQLRIELGDRIVADHGRLMVCEGEATPAAWAANIWRDVQEIDIASIGDAASKLRAVQRNWAVYAPLHFRRRSLARRNRAQVGRALRRADL